MLINFIKLNENAIVPTRGSVWAAGYDLYSCEDVVIENGCTAKVKTGLAMEIPEGYFGAIFARSGLATKQGLRPANCVGVVDADYRGEIIVALHNDNQQYEVNEDGKTLNSVSTKEIKAGERIAQLVIMPFLSVEFNEVEKLSETVRGESGFGSTGK